MLHLCRFFSVAYFPTRPNSKNTESDLWIMLLTLVILLRMFQKIELSNDNIIMYSQFL